MQRDGLLQKSYLNAYEKTLAGNPFSAKNREAQIEGALFNTEEVGANGSDLKGLVCDRLMQKKTA